MIGRTNSSIGGGKIKSLNKSCVVWLPLNGNYQNYGNSDLIFAPQRYGVSFTTGGNIFPCCLYSNSYDNSGIASDKAITLGNNQSFFCWFNFTGLMSSSELGGSMGGQHRYQSNTGLGLNFKYETSTTGYLTVSTGNGSSRTFNTYYGKTLLNAGAWYHGGYTYDGTTLKIYVNGQLDGSWNLPGLSNPGDYVQIGSWSFDTTSGNITHANYQLYGKMQDLRIYDRVLKDTEIQEIYNWRPLNKLRTKQVRYIRFRTAGSSANSYNHICEIEIYDENGNNVARNITPTAVAGSWNNLGRVTDGNRSASSYAEAANSGTIQIDLGSIKNIAYILEFYYYGDTRVYYNNLVQISTNGTTWETVWDGEQWNGRYYETSFGHMIPMVPGP